MLFGILKEGFSAYSSPVMLISRKVMQDKRVVTDFRHLNMRIAKNNLAYPLLKDTFTLLGSSKCEVLSVLDLKDAFHSLRLPGNSKKYCGILPHFGSASICIKECQWGSIFPLQCGNHTSMPYQVVCLARNIVKLLWMICYCSCPITKHILRS